MAVIAAIVRAQLLSIWNIYTRSRRGIAVSGMAFVLWYGMWSFVAYAAYAMARGASQLQVLVETLPRALLGIALYWQLSPMISASMGAALNLRKLLVYPIPHSRLFFIETLLRLTTGVEMLLVLAAGLAGLMLNDALAPGLMDALRMGAAIALFIAFNLLLAAGTRSLIERTLARRRVREFVVLAMVILVATPRLIVESGVTFDRFAWLFRGGGDFWLPWGAAAQLALGGPFLPLLTLVAWCGGAYLFGRSQFERNLRFDADAARATIVRPREERGRWSERMFRLPSWILPDPISAAVEKELRALSRAPRFRMVFVMGFTFGLLVWLPMVIGRRSGGVVSGHFLTFVNVYALALLGQVSYLNAFGFDRSAAQVYFVAPVPMGQIVIAKNIAAALYIFLEILLVTGVSLIFVPIAAQRVAEAFLATAVCAFYLIAVGNVLSVKYPKAASPERVGQGGPARRQGFIFLLFPLAIAPLLLAYGARHFLKSDAAFYMALAVAGSLGAALYWMSTRTAASIALQRREDLIGELSRGAGPITAD
jgi:ABC-2 type transport system permease protein